MTELKKLVPKRNYWKQEEEDLLKNWAEKAKCYHWLHNKSREIYQRKNAWFTIPVIIISTIVGTANFAQDRFNEEVRPYIVITIGSLSIIAGIITTIYQFLKISEINEGHRVSLLSWGKFYVDIESELARHPLDRMPPTELIKISKNEFSRLLEISPFIPKKVLNEFNKKFGDNNELITPEIGNNIAPLKSYKMNPENRQKMIDELNKGLIVKNKEIVKKKIDKDNKIDKFRLSFFDLNKRQPTKEEIKKNLRYTEIETYNSSGESSDGYLSDSYEIYNNNTNVRNNYEDDIYEEGNEVEEEINETLININESNDLNTNEINGEKNEDAINQENTNAEELNEDATNQENTNDEELNKEELNEVTTNQEDTNEEEINNSNDNVVINISENKRRKKILMSNQTQV